jgi:hypothetical protein
MRSPMMGAVLGLARTLALLTTTWSLIDPPCPLGALVLIRAHLWMLLGCRMTKLVVPMSACPTLPRDAYVEFMAVRFVVGHQCYRFNSLISDVLDYRLRERIGFGVGLPQRLHISP